MEATGRRRCRRAQQQHSGPRCFHRRRPTKAKAAAAAAAAANRFVGLGGFRCLVG